MESPVPKEINAHPSDIFKKTKGSLAIRIPTWQRDDTPLPWQHQTNKHLGCEKIMLKNNKKKTKPPFELDPNDSNDPSYSNLTLPYCVICRQRYYRAGVKQRKQFINEIRDHELLQTKALDGVRIHREFGQVVISSVPDKDIIKLTRKQRTRLDEIMDRTF